MNNYKTRQIIYCSVGGLLITGANACKTDNKPDVQEKPNVLFIAVDDLRPELGCYGEEHIHSPNIDKLSDEGIQFNRAYCNIPVCGASRASLLTGTRPTYNSLITYYTWIKKQRPNVPTIGKYFMNKGYHTIHDGKVMHHPGDAPGSWNEEWWPACVGSWRNYVLPENIKMDTADDKRGPAYECARVHDTAYKDGKIAEKAIRDLKKLKDADKPFFLATGFFKPHLPFNAPQKYWDLYNPENIEFPAYQRKPENAPDQSMHNSGELRSYANIPAKGPLDDSIALKLIHGYYACVSYTDAQIGKLLKALDDLDLSKNTIVILWGDHGWNLREHGLWCKHCNFETSLHVPLIIRVPGIKGGKKTNAITEYVDIYPSMCELCGLPLPSHLEGKSFVPVLHDPDKHVKKQAVSRWRNGPTLIKDEYFYTEWIDSTGVKQADMLFDHAVDPDETIDISDKEENKALVEKLDQALRDQWGQFLEK